MHRIQDNQDGRLLQETLTRAMIACGFEDVREHKPAVSGKNPVHPVHRCESKIYPCLTMNRFPATRRKRLFQVSQAPAPGHDGADHSRVKQGFSGKWSVQGKLLNLSLFEGLRRDQQDAVPQKLSTIHYPLRRGGVDHSRVKQVLFQIRPSMGSPLSPPMELAILTGRWMGVMYSLVQSIPSAL